MARVNNNNRLAMGGQVTAGEQPEVFSAEQRAALRSLGRQA
jgi:hypothetical protein